MNLNNIYWSLQVQTLTKDNFYTKVQYTSCVHCTVQSIVQNSNYSKSRRTCFLSVCQTVANLKIKVSADLLKKLFDMYGKAKSKISSYIYF